MDINRIREDFPILNEKIYGKPLLYFDNAATTQKPQSVINAIVDLYTHHYSNVHRGAHYLSEVSTEMMEISRDKIAKFINAPNPSQVVFTKGTTDSINLIAYSLSELLLEEGDEVLITEMEHHSNIVPWQMHAKAKNAIIKYIPLDENGELRLDLLETLITDRTKIIACTWVSNTLGTLNPVNEIITNAKQKGIPVVLDAAQSIQHIKADVQKLEVDFLAFSGHKIYGPTGVGVLYSHAKWLDKLPPYQGGGAMIKEVKMTHSTYEDFPFRLEAGTPNIAGNIVLGNAIDYVTSLGIEEIAKHEESLIHQLEEGLSKINRVKIIGHPQKRVGAISLNFENAHPLDVGTLLDKQGVAVRIGHHCCQPIMDKYCIDGTLRFSIGLYNTAEEVEKAIAALKKSLDMLYF